MGDLATILGTGILSVSAFGIVAHFVGADYDSPLQLGAAMIGMLLGWLARD